MASILPALLLVVLFACLAMLYNEGIWSNAIRLINVVTSALLAVNFFEPAAAWLTSMAPSFTYVWDFIALWVLFSIFFSVFRLLTDQVSKVKVRFLGIADRIGSGILALWIGWVMVCFTTTTLHTAPLSRNFLFGSFNADERMLMGLAPDRQWLGFVQKESLGPFCRSATPEEWKQEKFVFDPNTDFLSKYATRRAEVEEIVTKTGSIRVGAGN
jgi:hypothetical protein